MRNENIIHLERSNKVQQHKYDEIEKDFWDLVNKNTDLKDKVKNLKQEIGTLEEEKFNQHSKITDIEHSKSIIDTELRREREKKKNFESEYKRYYNKVQEKDKQIKQIEENFNIFGENILQLSNIYYTISIEISNSLDNMFQNLQLKENYKFDTQKENLNSILSGVKSQDYIKRLESMSESKVFVSNSKLFKKFIDFNDYQNNKLSLDKWKAGYNRILEISSRNLYPIAIESKNSSQKNIGYSNNMEEDLYQTPFNTKALDDNAKFFIDNSAGTNDNLYLKDKFNDNNTERGVTLLKTLIQSIKDIGLQFETTTNLENTVLSYPKPQEGKIPEITKLDLTPIKNANSNSGGKNSQRKKKSARKKQNNTLIKDTNAVTSNKNIPTNSPETKSNPNFLIQELVLKGNDQLVSLIGELVNCMAIQGHIIQTYQDGNMTKIEDFEENVYIKPLGKDIGETLKLLEEAFEKYNLDSNRYNIANLAENNFISVTTRDSEASEMPNTMNNSNLHLELIRKLKVCFGYRVKGMEQAQLIKRKSELIKHLEEEEIHLKENLEGQIQSAFELDELYYERDTINDELIRRKRHLEKNLDDKSQNITSLKKKNEDQKEEINEIKRKNKQFENEAELLEAQQESQKITYDEANENADKVNQRNMDEYRKYCEKEIDEMLEWERNAFWNQSEIEEQEGDKAFRKKSGTIHSDNIKPTKNSMDFPEKGTPQKKKNNSDNLTNSSQKKCKTPVGRHNRTNSEFLIMKLDKSPQNCEDASLIKHLKSTQEQIQSLDVKLLLEESFSHLKDGDLFNFLTINPNNFYWNHSNIDQTSQSIANSNITGNNISNSYATVIEKKTDYDQYNDSPKFGIAHKFDFLSLVDLMFEFTVRNTICYMGIFMDDNSKLKDDTYFKDFYQTLKILIDIIRATNLNSDGDPSQRTNCMIQVTSMFMSELRILTSKFV